MTDKTTKILLAILAAGLWLNAATTLIRPAQAQYMNPMVGLDRFAAVDPAKSMARDMFDIANGNCQNTKLCGH